MGMIVEKLRNWEKVYPEDEDKPEGSLYYEAADRIEELEAELEMVNKSPVEQIKELIPQYRIETLEEELREARLQELASLGQAQEAYEAQVALEAKLKKAVRALEIVDEWLVDLGMYADPDYHLAPSLQHVRDTLKELKE
jgi:uncharacterized protein YfaS (alpha-2-macroglobulin family)